MSEFLKLIRENSEQWRSLTEDIYGGETIHDRDAYDDEGEPIEGENFLVKNGYQVECVEHTGGESLGEEHHITIKVTKGDVVEFYRADGWYASHYGFSNDMDFYEAVPVEVKTIEYHRKA
jgi:hypothetical protein